MSATLSPLAFELETGALRMHGRTRSYQKHVADLRGVYADDGPLETLIAADPGRIAYTVDENHAGDGPGSLIIGLSVLQPGQVGHEFSMTRGHLHRRAECAELYFCVEGTGVMVMDDPDGDTSVLAMEPNAGVHVPGGWIHRSVNVGTTPLSMVFCYDADAGQDYEIISRAGGMRKLIVADTRGGWRAVPNPRHRGYS